MTHVNTVCYTYNWAFQEDSLGVCLLPGTVFQNLAATVLRNLQNMSKTYIF